MQHGADPLNPEVYETAVNYVKLLVVKYLVEQADLLVQCPRAFCIERGTLGGYEGVASWYLLDQDVDPKAPALLAAAIGTTNTPIIKYLVQKGENPLALLWAAAVPVYWRGVMISCVNLAPPAVIVEVNNLHVHGFLVAQSTGVHGMTVKTLPMRNAGNIRCLF